MVDIMDLLLAIDVITKVTKRRMTGQATATPILFMTAKYNIIFTKDPTAHKTFRQVTIDRHEELDQKIDKLYDMMSKAAISIPSSPSKRTYKPYIYIYIYIYIYLYISHNNEKAKIIILEAGTTLYQGHTVETTITSGLLTTKNLREYILEETIGVPIEVEGLIDIEVNQGHNQGKDILEIVAVRQRVSRVN